MAPKSRTKAFSVFSGEVLDVVAEAPVLIKYLPGDPTKPLAVCIPGGGHTARIFYGGHPGGRDRDFLAYWLNKDHQLGFLGLSYPTETAEALMLTPAPGYTVQDWGQQTAKVTSDIIQQHGLAKEVVLLMWSMGGRVLEPFTTSAEKLGVQVTVAVSLAATPGIYGLRPPVSGIKMSTAGYAYKDGAASVFLHQLELESKLNGIDAIIDPVSYSTFYLGTTPVNLTGWGLRYAEDDGHPNFKMDPFGDIQDARVFEWSALPMTAVIQPTHALDFMHALGDKAAWGLVLTKRLMAQFQERSPSWRHHDFERFRKFRDLVDEAPGRLCCRVEGNHFFFVGEEGARNTAKKLITLIRAVEHLQKELIELLDDQ